MADAKTTREYWDSVWTVSQRLSLPTGFWVDTRNIQRLLRAHVKPGMRVLEIGCAPGKTLAWVARVLRADVAGLDYSDRGLELARRLFRALAIDGDLRCEDLFETTFEPAQFDVVYSVGVIEHFDNPKEIVRRHQVLAKPGGKGLMTVPNYGGFYGPLQRWFDPGSLIMHNTAIMSPFALATLAPPDLVSDVRAYPAGRLSTGLLSLERRWPRPVARSIRYAFNLIGSMQPVDISRLCPILVLELTRKDP